MFLILILPFSHASGQINNTFYGMKDSLSKCVVGFHVEEYRSRKILFTRFDGNTYRSIDCGSTWLKAKNGQADDKTSVFASLRTPYPIHFTRLDGKRYDSYDGGQSYWSAATGRTKIGIETMPQNSKTAPAVLRPSQQEYSAEVTSVIPNPTNGKTVIHFTTRVAQRVRLTIEDRSGKEIIVLADRYVPASDHVVEFNASNLLEGLYNYRLTAKNLLSTGNIVVLHK